MLLLTLRGFTPVQIGLAEGVFHLASLCFELPSGMLADLMGPDLTPEKFNSAMKQLGFDSVVEVAIGADLCTIEEARIWTGRLPICRVESRSHLWGRPPCRDFPDSPGRQ